MSVPSERILAIYESHELAASKAAAETAERVLLAKTHGTYLTIFERSWLAIQQNRYPTYSAEVLLQMLIDKHKLLLVKRALK